MPHELRRPELLGALERLQLRTRRRLAGQLAGGHRSTRYGSSLDFADFRDYQPGDDFRRIDHLALARFDQVLVRLYDAEDDLTLRLVVDTSGSMGIDGKMQRAAELAGALGFVALTRRDRVELYEPGKPPLRFAGRSAVAEMFSRLEQMSAQGQGSLSRTATEVLARQRGAGLTIVLSDLLEPDWNEALSSYPARGSELAIMHILGAGELRPGGLGDVDLIDVESGANTPQTLAPGYVEGYGQRLTEWLELVEQSCRSLGAGYALVDAQSRLEEVLLGGLRQSEVVR